MDIKTYYNDTENYLNDKFLNKGLDENRIKVEKSWQEQRNYVVSASMELGCKIDYPSEFIMPDDAKKIETKEPDILVSWQLFDRTDYDRYHKTYNRLSVDWAKWDFTKVGLPEYKGGIFAAKTKETYKCGVKTIYLMEFDENIEKEYGLGKVILEKEDNFYTLRWLGKSPSRLPQALWLKFSGMDENWEIHKLGEWISPDDIIDSRLISAYEEGVRNKDVFIKGYDSALVAPFGRHLLEYKIGEKEQDLYFNLYNNIWNTNFPMWYGGNSVYRFRIIKRK